MHQLCKSAIINNKFQSNRQFKSHNTHFFPAFYSICYAKIAMQQKKKMNINF